MITNVFFSSSDEGYFKPFDHLISLMSNYHCPLNIDNQEILKTFVIRFKFLSILLLEPFIASVSLVYKRI